MMEQKFDITPEKEASILTFIHRQITFTPAPVTGVDLSGKTAIVTGANVGIGLESSRQLLDLGLSKLVLAVRDEVKRQAAADDLRKSNAHSGKGGIDIEVWRLDLSDYDSIISFVDRANNNLATLDIAILNAAVIPFTFNLNARTKHEQGFQVTYLSTALLMLLLLPVAASKRRHQPQPTRITLVSTEGAAWAAFAERDSVPLLAAFDKEVSAGDTNAFQGRHFAAKTLGQLFLTKLAASVSPEKVAVINAATPGMCHDTQLSRELDETWKGKVAKAITRRIGYTASVGSRMIVDAALNHGPQSHGQYFSGQKLKPMAPIVYTEQGKKVMDRLWQETLDELAFAGVKEIMADLRTDK